jgi:hypothetical protein
MGKFSDALKRTIRRSDVTLKASGAETASTTGTGVEVGEGQAVNVTVDVTAVSGTTPTMTVVIEGSNDGTNWYELGTIGANGAKVGQVGTAPSNLTATATVRASLPGARHVRSRSVIGGTTPSFTYSVLAEVAG